eukprot:COSAG01_NODE_170_length_23136_cov_24.853931_15_plen_813_part_00
MPGAQEVEGLLSQLEARRTEIRQCAQRVRQCEKQTAAAEKEATEIEARRKLQWKQNGSLPLSMRIAAARRDADGVVAMRKKALLLKAGYSPPTAAAAAAATAAAAAAVTAPPPQAAESRQQGHLSPQRSASSRMGPSAPDAAERTAVAAAAAGEAAVPAQPPSSAGRKPAESGDDDIAPAQVLSADATSAEPQLVQPLPPPPPQPLVVLSILQGESASAASLLEGQLVPTPPPSLPAAVLGDFRGRMLSPRPSSSRGGRAGGPVARGSPAGLRPVPGAVSSTNMGARAAAAEQQEAATRGRTALRSAPTSLQNQAAMVVISDGVVSGSSSGDGDGGTLRHRHRQSSSPTSEAIYAVAAVGEAAAVPERARPLTSPAKSKPWGSSAEAVRADALDINGQSIRHRGYVASSRSPTDVRHQHAGVRLSSPQVPNSGGGPAAAVARGSDSPHVELQRGHRAHGMVVRQQKHQRQHRWDGLDSAAGERRPSYSSAMHFAPFSPAPTTGGPPRAVTRQEEAARQELMGTEPGGEMMVLSQLTLSWPADGPISPWETTSRPGDGIGLPQGPAGPADADADAADAAADAALRSLPHRSAFSSPRPLGTRARALVKPPATAIARASSSFSSPPSSSSSAAAASAAVAGGGGRRGGSAPSSVVSPAGLLGTARAASTSTPPAEPKRQLPLSSHKLNRHGAAAPAVGMRGLSAPNAAMMRVLPRNHEMLRQRSAQASAVRSIVQQQRQLPPPSLRHPQHQPAEGVHYDHWGVGQLSSAMVPRMTMQQQQQQHPTSTPVSFLPGPQGGDGFSRLFPKDPTMRVA